MGKGCTNNLEVKEQTGIHRWNPEQPEVKEGGFTEYHAWDMVNSMVCFWLLNVIDQKLRPSVAYAETAKAIWEDLQKRYGVVNAPKVYQLMAKLAECRQVGMTIVEFYSNLRGL